MTDKFKLRNGSENPLPTNLRFVVSGTLFLLLLVVLWHSGRAGVSSLLSAYAASTSQIAPANAAVRIGASDPDGHYVRGVLIENSGELQTAIAEYTEAASLRPGDYVLWLNLARAREIGGDIPGALHAAKQAVGLAPYYSQPRWLFGNLLIRAGQLEDGFGELRKAADNNPILLPGIIDLAWQLSGGDIEFVKRVIDAKSSAGYQSLAEYFMKQGKTFEAIAMFRAAGEGGNEGRRQYIEKLISTGQFKDAYALWSAGRHGNSSDIYGVLMDPGFERDSNFGEPGFGWRTGVRNQSVSLVLDGDNPREGRSSLRIEFSGESDPRVSIVSQLVLIEPDSHYRLSFAARSESIVSGSLPQVVITDATSRLAFGSSAEITRDASGGWQDFSMAFNSGKSTGAIQITLRREQCNTSPCPIFGRLWLDNFFLTKL